MKFSSISRMLAIAVILPLLVMAIPGSPVLAAESIRLSPTAGGISDEIEVKGDGFKTDKTRVYIYFSSQEGAVYDRIDDEITVYKLTKKTTPDIDGNIRVSFEVPEMLDEGIEGRFSSQEVVGGNYYVYVTYGDDDKIEAVAEFTVRGIKLNPTSGVANDTVAVTGVGFGEDLTVSITFAGEEVSTSPPSINTDEDGSFTASFSVPDVVVAAYDVRVADEAGNEAKAEFTVAVAPGITIRPVTTPATPGYVGMKVTISGIGFKIDSAITITYAAEPIAVATSDGDGAFLATFLIPKSASGGHPITASDGVNTKQLSFIMESQAPPKPVLLLPEDGAETEAQAFFDWGSISDDSHPVSYILQVASSENFTSSSIVLEKTALTNSKYLVTQGLEPTEEDAPYYWKVRAIDGASNEGEWSTIGTFYVAKPAEPSLPSRPERFGWLIYLWIGLGIVAAAVLGYWLRKKIARSRQV